jgi:hypothetical protein
VTTPKAAAQIEQRHGGAGLVQVGVPIEYFDSGVDWTERWSQKKAVTIDAMCWMGHIAGVSKSARIVSRHHVFFSLEKSYSWHRDTMLAYLVCPNKRSEGVVRTHDVQPQPEEKHPLEGGRLLHVQQLARTND